jgi:flagellar basal body rod protein FlgG
VGRKATGLNPEIHRIRQQGCLADLHHFFCCFKNNSALKQPSFGLVIIQYFGHFLNLFHFLQAQGFMSKNRLSRFKTEVNLMIFSAKSTLSALNAFDKKMNVIANNVANVETEEFKKSRATLVEGPENSVRVEITQPEDRGPTVVEVKDGQIEKKEMSNVDLTEEIPQSIVAQRGYEANLATIRTQDEMLNSILDIVG